MSTKTYDPALYTVAVAAIPIKKGYADGEFISIKRDTDAFTDVAGTDGDVAREAARQARVWEIRIASLDSFEGGN